MKTIYMQIIKAGLFLLAVFAGTGCTDFLDRQPLSDILDNNFWTNEGDAKLALVGCYRFHSGWTHDDFATPQGLIYLDFAGGNSTEKENFTTLGMTSSNTVATSGYIEGYWNNAYSLIAHYNTFLDNIGSCPMDEVKKEMWAAEVKMPACLLLLLSGFSF